MSPSNISQFMENKSFKIEELFLGFVPSLYFMNTYHAYEHDHQKRLFKNGFDCIAILWKHLVLKKNEYI